MEKEGFLDDLIKERQRPDDGMGKQIPTLFIQMKNSEVILFQRAKVELSFYFNQNMWGIMQKKLHHF